MSGTCRILSCGRLAHGTPTNTSSTQSHLDYTGQYTDTETGHRYLQAHYDDPATGQFLTAAPVTASTREPYGYGHGDPLEFSDPASLCSVSASAGDRLPSGNAATELEVRGLRL